jgi:hypothetical protein
MEQHYQDEIKDVGFDSIQHLVIILGLHSIGSTGALCDASNKHVTVGHLIASIQSIVKHTRETMVNAGRTIEFTIILMTCSLPISALELHFTDPHIKYVYQSFYHSITQSAANHMHWHWYVCVVLLHFNMVFHMVWVRL